MGHHVSQCVQAAEGEGAESVWNTKYSAEAIEEQILAQKVWERK